MQKVKGLRSANGQLQIATRMSSPASGNSVSNTVIMLASDAH